jgi:hypothetical protein
MAGNCFAQYQNKWRSRLGKEYNQRTGGWEHLGAKEAAENREKIK